MSDPIIFWPDQQPLSIQMATWNPTTLVQEWHEVAGYCPVPGGLQLGTRPAQGGVADGTLQLEIPLAEDVFNFEAWNEVRISGTVAGPPVGGYPRHFRGYALKRDSHTDGIENLYSFQLIDGWMRVEKPPATLVDERTWRGEDHAIIHAMAYNCWPALYPSGAATPAAPVTAPAFTQSNTGGTLTAGKWRVAYAWANPSGPTALSNSAIPVFSAGVTTGKITVTIPGTLPAGATGAQLYVAVDADALDRVWAADVAGPGTYTITAPPTGSLPPLAPILPYPTAPHTDQPNVNNYSSVQTPTFGPIEVPTKAATLAQGLEAVQHAVPADYEVPRAMLWWKPDNAAHTAGWDWQLTWLRDTDTPIYGIVAINVNYTQPEDSTHTFYYSMQRSRDGGPVGNVQTVQGDWIAASNRYATATVSSSVSYQEIGVYLSLPPVIDRDLKTDAECAARARQLIDAAKLVQETLANVVTYTPYPILGATRVRVRNLYEGGLDDPIEANLPVYTIAHAAATYREAGLEYQLELGAGFAELGEARTRFVGGSSTTTSGAPPAVPQWHDTPAADIVSNTYDPTSHLSTLVASWLADTTGLVAQYEPQWSWDGGTTWNAGFAVPPLNPPSAGFTGAAGASITIQVRARNVHGIASAWSASRTITLAARQAPAAPVWVGAYTTATESATTGSALLTWTDGVGGSGTPAQWAVHIVPAAGGAEGTILVNVRTILLHALVIGATYNVTVMAYTATGDWGPVSAVKAIVVAQDAPGAPATVTVTGTRTGPNTGQANLSWTAGTGGTGTATSYEARYYVTASGAGSAVIVPVPSDNRVLTIPGLPVGTGYTFNVRSITPYGIAGPWSTSAPTLTLAAQAPPAPTGLTVLNYDPGQTGPSAWIQLGWTPGVGGTGTVATWNVRVDWTESSTGIVRKWHKNGIPASDTSTILSPLTAGPSYTITLWGITAWGDSSSAATLVYSLTPPLTDGVYNGGMEVADPSNKTQADGWTPDVINGIVDVALDSTTSADGLYSVKLGPVSLHVGTADILLTSRPFRLAKGSNFALRFQLRADTLDTTFYPRLHYYDRDGVQISFATLPSVTAAAINTWQGYAGMSPTPAPTNAVMAAVKIEAVYLTGSANAWLDAVDVRPLSLTADYDDASVTGAKLAADAVDSTVLADGSVTTPKLALLAVDSTILADASVIAAKIGTSAVTNTKIQANAVTTAKITDGNVTAAKLANTTVTPGSYTYMSGTVDAQGRLTAASSGAAPLTDPLTTRGDLLARNASNVTARLAIGTTGKVLHSNGTDPSWQALVAADLPAATVSAQGAVVLATPSSDVTAGHVVQASDARLSDTRTPTDGTVTKAKMAAAMAALQQGTSNPALPFTGDTVFRSDKGRVAYYDGTRWLSDAPVPLPWLNNANLNPFSVSGIDAWYSILPNDMPLYLERWTSLVRGNTTNNASNFWTIALQGFTGGVGTTLDSFTTAALTVNALTTQHRALTTALTAGQYDFLALIATKTGAPGTLLLIPHLRAREILT
jgi:hypothetical protein